MGITKAGLEALRAETQHRLLGHEDEPSFCVYERMVLATIQRLEVAEEKLAVWDLPYDDAWDDLMTAVANRWLDETEHDEQRLGRP